MAEGGQLGIVEQAVLSEPPLAQIGGDEGRHQTADIDKHIEYLETAVAAALHGGQRLGPVFGGLSLHIVVHLSHDGLQVALEETIAEGDEEEGQAGEGQQPRGVLCGGHDGDGEEHIAQGHDDKAGADGALVVLRAVGDDTAHEAQHIDAGVEHRVDDTAGGIAQTEL